MSDKEFLLKMGAKIRTIRKSRNISLRDLEKYKITDRGHLSRLENGQVSVKALTLKQLAEVLSCNVYDFFIFA